MLRLIAAALLLANAMYFVWSLGWLDGLTPWRATGDREPQRMARQVRPEIVELTPVAQTLPASPTAQPLVASAPPAKANGAPAASEPSAASAPVATASRNAASAPVAAASAPRSTAASAPATTPAASGNAASAAVAASDSAAKICLEAGPFASEAERSAAEAAIRKVIPDASLAQRRRATVGEWMIFMGPYPDDAFLERKKAELSRIRGGLKFEEVGPTPLFGRGISLGRFASQAEADKTLDSYRPRGIRTAKVIRSAEGPPSFHLQMAAVEPALAERLAAVDWPSGQGGFKPCPPGR